LFQPIHRTFYVAILEAACETFGHPRLDPRKIDGAGLVIRRRGPGGAIEGWRQVGATVRGWVVFRDGAEASQDPDPKRRPASQGAGHPEIDRRLALRRLSVEPLAESFSPLYVAAPRVCDATGRTLLYGLMRLTSSEQNETPASPPTYSDDQMAALKDHFPRFLQAASPPPSFPRPNATLTVKDVDGLAADAAGDKFLLMLRQLSIELNVFGWSPSGANPQTKALYNEINSITLQFADGSTRGAAEFLADAARVLIERDAGLSVWMPKEWPGIDSAQADRIFQLSLAVLGSQYSNIAPREGRFDGIDRQFVARAFIRVKHDDPDCPPDVIWSEYSEPFTIAAWYETGNASPVTIVLPDATVIFSRRSNQTSRLSCHQSCSTASTATCLPIG
jgi:hypothetical protein